MKSVDNAQDRSKVCAIAKTWLKTPYHSHACVKGAGADCLTFWKASFEEAGLIDFIDLPPYSPQFMLHSSEETYLNALIEHGYEVETPQPADIAIWKFGRCFSHAGLVIDWPIIIHAFQDGFVQYEDVSKAEWLTKNNGKPREVRFFSYWRPDVIPFA